MPIIHWEALLDRSADHSALEGELNAIRVQSGGDSPAIRGPDAFLGRDNLNQLYSLAKSGDPIRASKARFLLGRIHAERESASTALESREPYGPHFKIRLLQAARRELKAWKGPYGPVSVYRDWLKQGGLHGPNDAFPLYAWNGFFRRVADLLRPEYNLWDHEVSRQWKSLQAESPAYREAHTELASIIEEAQERRKRNQEYFPEVFALLELIGAPFAAYHRLVPFVYRQGREAAFEKIACARVAGVDWESIPMYWSERESGIFQKTPVHELERAFGSPAYHYQAWIRPMKDQLWSAPEIGGRLRPFPADFLSLPFTANDGVSGVYADARLFVMRLPEGEHEALLMDEPHLEARYHNVVGAFAYIRYYEKAGQYVIAEIQSEYYGEIRNRRWLERLKHWAEFLLTAFECFLRATRPGLVARVLIADADYQRRRWPESETESGQIIPGIADSLAHRIYEKLPEKMGYRSETIDLADLEAKVGLTRGWSREVQPSPPAGSYGSQFDALAQVSVDNPFTTWRKKASILNRLGGPIRQVELTVEPGGHRYTVDGQDLTVEVAPFFEAAPQLPIPLHHMSGITPELLETHDRLWTGNPVLRVLLEALNPREFSLISKGADQGVPDNWDAIGQARFHGWHLSPIHTLHQNRHPHLRFQYHGPDRQLIDCFSLGIKGGGLSTREKMGGPLFSEVSRSAPLQPIHFDFGASPQSHVYWGGLIWDHAEIEMLQTLGVHRLMLESDGKPAAAPLPYDIGSYSHLPVWHAPGRTQWLESAEYMKTYLLSGGIERKFSEFMLNLLPGIPAFYRSVSPADMRIVSLYEDLIRQPLLAQARFGMPADPRELTRKINSHLAAAYRFNGLPFNAPETGLELEDGRLTWRALMAYFARAYSLNSEGASRIAGNIEETMLRTIAAVHGAGGHLGGNRVPIVVEDGHALRDARLGAINGGPPSMRNTDVSGVMHDWDMDVYLPWVEHGALRGRMHRRNESALAEMQIMDLGHWQETAYWLRQILFGRELKPGQKLAGRPFNFSGIGMSPLPQGQEEPFRLFEGSFANPEQARFRNERHQRLYGEYHERGRGFQSARKQWPKGARSSQISGSRLGSGFLR